MTDCHDALTDDEFNQLRELIYAHTGISLADHKRALVYSRLAKRLRFHGLNNYTEYHALLTKHDPDGKELEAMTNAITTNKTDFFRESHHFDFLANHILPELKQRVLSGGKKEVRIWSAGASTGQEPYSIAMTTFDTLPPTVGWQIKILATDIATDVLEFAERGIYSTEQIAQVPKNFLRRYFKKSKGGDTPQVAIKTIVKEAVTFRRLNLHQEPWPMRIPFDIIFCRNVIIYFDKPTQRRLVARMAEILNPGGYLVLGHSETLYGINSNFDHLGKNIYQYNNGT